MCFLLQVRVGVPRGAEWPPCTPRPWPWTPLRVGPTCPGVARGQLCPHRRPRCSGGVISYKGSSGDVRSAKVARGPQLLAPRGQGGTDSGGLRALLAVKHPGFPLLASTAAAAKPGRSVTKEAVQWSQTEPHLGELGCWPPSTGGRTVGHPTITHTQGPRPGPRLGGGGGSMGLTGPGPPLPVAAHGALAEVGQEPRVQAGGADHLPASQVRGGLREAHCEWPHGTPGAGGPA